MTDIPKTAHPIVAPKKLIEVALPLDEINKASAREKSIRHGHPSTLHLWWARRPLAAARAVLFAQMVNDPSWKYSEEELKKPQVKSAITRKRNELFRLITQLVQWENINKEEVLSKARAAIRESWRETCEANKKHPEAKTLFDPDKLPPFHDPFAGGGSIPLEAQRLGLEAHATDLNPVAVLLNKAMIEIPPKFAGRAPVGPIPLGEKQTKAKGTEDWSRTRGLAEDVRRYGAWMREEAWKRVGHLYPRVKITEKMAKERPELKSYIGDELTVIAWLWARTVASPNPAVNGKHVPLVSSWFVSKKPGREVWIEALRKGNDYNFVIRSSLAGDKITSETDGGTRAGGKATFKCLLSGATISRDYIAEEGKAGRIGKRLLAIVGEGSRQRVYLSPRELDIAVDELSSPAWTPDQPIGLDPRAISPPAYGLSKFSDLFTPRQLTVLCTLADLITEVRSLVTQDAVRSFGGTDSSSLIEGGTGAKAYGEALSLYLSFAVSRSVDRSSTLCSWDSSPKMEALRNTFGRPAMPMVWDFAEGNQFSASSGNWNNNVEWVADAIETLPASVSGFASQRAAQELDVENQCCISTDPPYYDNVGYADLSDFFYVWLRRMCSPVMRSLFGTMLVPKAEELVVNPYRNREQKDPERFFMDGMTDVIRHMVRASHPAIPISIYYAFKQSETAEIGTVSTGWEKFLEAVLTSGCAVVGTWPARSELANRIRSIGSNALASSIVLACRPRSLLADSISRRQFLRELGDVLPTALDDMTGASGTAVSVAPVDLAQAAIGPGMAIFSKYKSVLEADGSSMSVHNALIHINKAIDDYFAQAEGDLDADTRFCIGWFQQHEYGEGLFGDADVLARAKGTSVDGVREAGVIHSSKGKVQLLRVKEYPTSWDPKKDSRLPIWEACHQMCRALGESESEAGALLARMPDKQDAIRQLAYRLYTICERKGWAEDARAYNELVTSWPAIVEQSLKAGHKGSQMSLL